MSHFTTPEWVHHAIFYQIFPDRFAKSTQLAKPAHIQPWGTAPQIYNFMGGDLLGIVEKLDYLQDLGITAIYLNPIFQSASNHRYHTHDYFQIDPLLGGRPAFDALLNACKKRGLRLVLDGVFNHASRGFFQFNHILECGADSPYVDWFTINGYPLHAYEGQPNYRAWWGIPALPEFNFNNREVRDFLLGVGRYWLEQGIDGWRLDVAFEVEDDFWQEFRPMVKAVNPDAWILAETVEESQRWLQGDMYDGVMHYPLTGAMINFFAGDTFNPSMFARPDIMAQRLQAMDAPAFAERATHLFNSYPWQATLAQMNLLDSHDMPRFLTIANGDESALRLAWLFLFTIPGAPCIYYGNEIGMMGGFDPDNRVCFPWEQARWKQSLHTYLQSCIRLRQTYPALRIGQFHVHSAQGHVMVYTRQTADETFYIAINAGRHPTEINLPIAESIFGEPQRTNSGWRLPARTGCVWQAI